MSVFTALFAGVNGIGSNGEAVSIIGDNIANVNTTGYKVSRPEFEDVMAGLSTSAGLGSRLASTTTLFSQGGFESTSVVTDMAIDGKGFFAVKDIANATTYYSRAGQFSIDQTGYLVNPEGQRLQGFGIDTSGNLQTTAADIQFTFQPVPPNPTSSIVVKANLDANETEPAGAFDVDDPAGTSNFAVGVTTYDSLGNSHLTTIYYRKSAADGDWTWHALSDGADITGGTPGTPVIGAQGTLSFDSNGALTSVVTSSSDFDYNGAVQSQAIAFDFGNTTSGGNDGYDGITQFGTSSVLNDLSQDGYKSGSLSTIEISSDGTITGNYTNGTTQTLGQVTLATFANEQGLSRVGGNAYAATLDSGTALIAAAEDGGRGSVLSQTLEQSNVDLANELIKMVIIQRGFQANSRTISVVNDLLGSLVSLGQ